MERFLDQVPALIGVVLGIFGTLLATALTDRARWRRDQAVRWDERRLDAYVAYAASVKEIHSTAFRLAAIRDPSIRAAPIERERGLEILNHANVRRTQTLEAVRLLADAATVKAVRDWQDAVHRWERAEMNDGDIGDWANLVRSVDEARDQFYSAARASLGVRGSVAESVLLSQRSF